MSEIKCYETLPAGYYQDRANQHINWPLHYLGRKALQKFLEVEQRGQKLTVVAPDSVYDAAWKRRPVLVAATHRSWMDISFFVQATQAVWLSHTRPLSKIENLQKHPALSRYYHDVGLFGAVRDDPDLEGIELVFASDYKKHRNDLVFPEGTRVLQDIEHVASYARTPAMMAIKYGFGISSLAIVGGGVGETQPSRHLIRGKRIPVADTPVAQFGDVIYLPHQPDLSPKELVRQAGIATRTILRPDLQQTLDIAYGTRAMLMGQAA